MNSKTNQANGNSVCIEDQTEWSHQRRHAHLRSDIPLRSVELNGDYARLAADSEIIMMASDWIPNELPHEELALSEADLDQQRPQLDRMVPKWATQSMPAAKVSSRFDDPQR